jgi:hypothetical protein
MPAGDAQRAWFPEMLSELEQRWYSDMTWSEYIELCVEMTGVRENIWKMRDIKPAKMWCPNCQEYHNSRPPPLSIRSMLFALKKLQIVDDNQFKELEKSWNKYRKSQNLDSYGKQS